MPDEQWFLRGLGIVNSCHFSDVYKDIPITMASVISCYVLQTESSHVYSFDLWLLHYIHVKFHSPQHTHTISGLDGVLCFEVSVTPSHLSHECTKWNNPFSALNFIAFWITWQILKAIQLFPGYKSSLSPDFHGVYNAISYPCSTVAMVNNTLIMYSKSKRSNAGNITIICNYNCSIAIVVFVRDWDSGPWM